MMLSPYLDELSHLAEIQRKKEKAEKAAELHDLFNAWQFLENHPIFSDGSMSMFSNCRVIEVVRVNPETNHIDDDESKNTATRIWLECGPWLEPEKLDEFHRQHFPNGIPTHDIKLDCGAPTFEEAIIKLAELVLEQYGDGNGQ